MFRIFLIFSLVFINSCAVIKHYEQLITLQRLGRNQDETQTFVKNAQDSFEKILEDIENENIYPGLTEEDIYIRYGEPVLVKYEDDDKVLLYRYPTKFYKSERVYFYLNDKNVLAKWDHKPEFY